MIRLIDRELHRWMCRAGTQTKQRVCRTVLGDGGEARGSETVAGEAGAYWSHVFLWTKLHQTCFRNHSWADRDLKHGRNERVYVHFGVIMFFRKDPPQTEGRRDADLLIKTWPGGKQHTRSARCRGVTVL